MEDFLADIPSPFTLKEPIFGLDMHPSRNLVAFSSASGSIQVAEYVPNGTNKILQEFKHHTKSCRSVQFSEGDGAQLFSCSSDKSIVGVDLETGKTIFEQKKAHKEPLSTMFLHQNLLFTGDEDGIIKVWDQRKPDKVREIAENDEYISSFIVNSDRNTLLAASGDGTLTIIDYASGKAIDRSEDQDDELLSLALIKGGRKVVAGGQSGLLSIFSWDQWADRSSVCPGHIESIDCMIPVDDNTVITGCGDGIIRIVSILPNKIIGVVSAQTEELPITSLSLSHDRKYLAAIVDSTVQFWNVSMLFEDDDENEEGEEEEDVVEEDGAIGEEDTAESVLEEDIGEDEVGEELTPSSDDDSDDEDDDDDDSSSSEEAAPAQRGMPSKRGGRRVNADKAAFFGDL